jgi:hypothetical protein
MNSKHTHSASYREVLIEHLFVGDIMRRLWLRGISQFEVLKPQVDDSGYDLVLEANSILRHVQLKSSTTLATTAEVHASMNLLTKPGACVIWIRFDPETILLGPYFWFGGKPGERLPDIAQFKTAKHVRANSKGVKNERPNHRLIPKSKFERVADAEGIILRLFGDLALPQTTTPPALDSSSPFSANSK